MDCLVSWIEDYSLSELDYIEYDIALKVLKDTIK
jgi:hypothetical protein